MKKTISILMMIFLSAGIYAQKITSVKSVVETPEEDGWKYGGFTGLNFNQVAFTNWAAGGENSYASNALIGLYANYMKGKSSWDNSLDLGYGVAKVGNQDVRKSDDKIDLASKYGYKLKEKWFLSALANFKTQFADGYNYPDNAPKELISKFMAPGYLLAGIGIDYKPHENFSFFLSPITSKSTFVVDDSLSAAGAYGVTRGDKSLHELGAYFNALAKVNVMKNVDLSTKLNLFSSYTNNPQNIDVNWETNINMKVNKYITANLNTNLIYDHDILIADKNGKEAPRTQFKELFGVGFLYKF